MTPVGMPMGIVPDQQPGLEILAGDRCRLPGEELDLDRVDPPRLGMAKIGRGDRSDPDQERNDR